MSAILVLPLVACIALAVYPFIVKQHAYEEDIATLASIATELGYSPTGYISLERQSVWSAYDLYILTFYSDETSEILAQHIEQLGFVQRFYYSQEAYSQWKLATSQKKLIDITVYFSPESSLSGEWQYQEHPIPGGAQVVMISFDRRVEWTTGFIPYPDPEALFKKYAAGP